MATDLTGLLNKVENKGETPQGKLSADEFNTLVRAVRENQESVRTVSYNGGVKIRPDENGNVDLIITESNYILRLKTTVDGVAPYKVALGNEYNMTIEVSNKYLDGDEQVEIPAGKFDYSGVVDALVQYKYPIDKMQTTINNYLLDPYDEYAISEFNAMQAWRKEAKEIAKEALLYELP